MYRSHSWLNTLRAAFGSSTARFALAETLASHDAHTAAFRQFARAARARLPRAQYRLGRSYLLGLGVPPSIGEALRWLRRSAEAGDTAAQTQLAALALQGVSDNGAAGLFHDGSQEATSDYETAERWCRKAVAAGSIEAKALLGFILTVGPESLRDTVTGETLYREAAQAGWSRGQLGLAMTFLRDGTTERAAESVALLRSAATDGVAVAHHLMGMLAESGAAGSVDFTAAAASYKAAAELGHPQATGPRRRTQRFQRGNMASAGGAGGRCAGGRGGRLPLRPGRRSAA
jgi:TPR repeat protein